MASTLLFRAVTDRWSLELRTRSTSPLDDPQMLRQALGEEQELPETRWTCDTPADWTFLEEPAVANMLEAGHTPLVFENRQYLLRIRTTNGLRLENISHPWSREVEQGFDIEPDSCHATLRTGNDIGRFSLEISTKGDDGDLRTDRITWQVWPLKLDYGRDLKALTEAVEREYPLWLYRFLAPTDHEAGRSDRAHDRFLLLWLKQFEALQKRFEHGVRTVIRSPHQRLDEHVRHLRADRIRGRMSPRLEESVATGMDRPQKRYRVESRRSSFDTIENRFVKHAVGEVAARLEQVEVAMAGLLAQNQDGQTGVSDGFQRRLQGWRRTARSQAATPVFRTIGDFDGLTQESLVLHHRAGYSAVYRAWLELRHYLEFFSRLRTTNIGMRQISELYELWCFLKLREILESLGFKDETTIRHPQLWKKNELETALENGFGAAYLLRHEQAGITLRLAHEPVFGNKGTEGVHSYTVSQKPDIVLEATWSNGKRLLWIFDAKYRVKTVPDERDASRSQKAPLVPPDALDQMHRYRDALILRLAQEAEKSRPVVGAYALYPGVFRQTESDKNPYAPAIHEVGIGAFPLLPRHGHDVWLREHLRTALGLDDVDLDAPGDPAALLAQENVRIPVTGLEYRDEVLVLPVGRDRSPEYMEAFASGRALGYHIDVEGGPSRSRLGATRWLAASIPMDDGRRVVRGLYRISSREIRQRSSLGSAETGSICRRDREVHWLSLENWIPLDEPLIVRGWMGGNWFRYFDRALLEKARDFKELGSAT